MWLRKHAVQLDEEGYTGWQRVEAFRSMLRKHKRALAGNGVPTRKGPTDTGILDCVALLTNDLPPLSSLKKAALAEPEID